MTSTANTVIICHDAVTVQDYSHALRNDAVTVQDYSHALGNDVTVNDGPH